MYELKLVIRKAMILVEGRIRFDHAFPSPADRSVWNRLALAEACTVLESISHSPNVKVKYNWIQQRVEVDDQYVSDISTIVGSHISCQAHITKLESWTPVLAFYEVTQRRLRLSMLVRHMVSMVVARAWFKGYYSKSNTYILRRCM